MSKKRGQLQAYLAGIVDGEGSFGIYAVGGAYTARFTVAMQDPQAVAYLKLLYPDGAFSKRGPEYRAVYASNRAYEITQDLLPFLIVKREQAQVMLSFMVHRRRDHQHKAANGQGLACERCKRYMTIISDIKHRDPKGVNSVNALLKHGMREYRAKRADVEQDVTNILSLLEGVETRDRLPQAVEPTSAPEQEIVQAASAV